MKMVLQLVVAESPMNMTITARPTSTTGPQGIRCPGLAVLDRQVGGLLLALEQTGPDGQGDDGPAPRPAPPRKTSSGTSELARPDGRQRAADAGHAPPGVAGLHDAAAVPALHRHALHVHGGVHRSDGQAEGRDHGVEDRPAWGLARSRPWRARRRGPRCAAPARCRCAGSRLPARTLPTPATIGTAASTMVSWVSSRPNLSRSVGTWDSTAAKHRPCTAKAPEAAIRARRSRTVTPPVAPTVHRPERCRP